MEKVKMGKLRIKTFTKGIGLYDTVQLKEKEEFHIPCVGSSLVTYYSNGVGISKEVPLSQVRNYLKNDFFNGNDHEVIRGLLTGKRCIVHILREGKNHKFSYKVME